MKIPTEFELFGQTIIVVWDNDMLNDKELYAQANYRANQIDMATECIIDGKRQKLPQDKINAAFCHELIHWILQKMGDKKENDELFVETFANLLYQFIKTAKYK